MLQQTQVATVIPFFRRFLERFPTLKSLAGATEQDVLRAWQGLGYYSRARNLQATARTISQHNGGRIPETLEELLTLPGVGRYTAGAIASLAYDRRAPILDGNVARVLCRIDRIDGDPKSPPIAKRLWVRAEQILPTKRVGDFNSALMELGATVCTPRFPKCLACPVRSCCEAFAAGVQDRIPPPRRMLPKPLHRRWTICVRDKSGRWLIEQRPPRGRWAGMWQFPSAAAPALKKPTRRWVRKAFGLSLQRVRRLGEIAHSLSHRRYHFTVFAAETTGRVARSRSRKWVTGEELAGYPLSRPQVRIAELAGAIPVAVASE